MPEGFETMTTVAPLFYDPEYEEPAEGCELQVRWPRLLGAARSSSVASELPVFYEWAPLPGGFLLAGVGHAKRSRDPVQPSLRETILAMMLAGSGKDILPAWWTGACSVGLTRGAENRHFGCVADSPHCAEATRPVWFSTAPRHPKMISNGNGPSADPLHSHPHQGLGSAQ
jgi:hypothetical protein